MVDKRKTQRVLRDIAKATNTDVARMGGEPLILPNYSGIKEYSDKRNLYDLDYLKIDGSNANQHVTLGSFPYSYDFTARQIVASESMTANTLAMQGGQISDSSGAISFDNENLTTTGTIQGNKLNAVTSVDTPEINSAGNIILRPNDDANDYLELYMSGATYVMQGVGCPLYFYSDTSAISLVADGDTSDYVQIRCTSNVPEIKRIGGSVLHFTTDSGNKTLRCYKDGSNYLDFGWEGTSDYGYVNSPKSIRFISNSDTSDYIDISTTSNRTTLEFANQNGIISSNNGAGFVDFSTCDIVGKQKASSGTTEFRIIGDTQTDHEVGMRMYAGSNYPVFFTEGNTGYFVIKGTSMAFMSNTEFGFYNDKIFRFGHGGSAHGGLSWNTSQTNPCVYFGLSDYGGGNAARTLLIADFQDDSGDYAHGVQSNPTVFIHSNTAAATATDEWISLTHDVTDGVIDVGSGKIKVTDPQCVGDYYSNDGTQGWTGTFTEHTGKTVTVKNGIITDCS